MSGASDLLWERADITLFVAAGLSADVDAFLCYSSKLQLSRFK